MVLASKCFSNGNNSPWSYVRGAGKCEPLGQDVFKDGPGSAAVANDIVFIFQVRTGASPVALAVNRNNFVKIARVLDSDSA